MYGCRPRCRRRCLRVRRCTGDRAWRIEQQRVLAHALAGGPIDLQQQVEVGIVHRRAAGDANHLATVAEVDNLEFERQGRATAGDAGTREILARGQLHLEVVQVGRMARMHRDFRQQGLAEGRLDLDLAEIQRTGLPTALRHDLAAAQGQRHQHRPLQRTIHHVFPRTNLALSYGRQNRRLLETHATLSYKLANQQ